MKNIGGFSAAVCVGVLGRVFVGMGGKKKNKKQRNKLWHVFEVKHQDSQMLSENIVLTGEPGD